MAVGFIFSGQGAQFVGMGRSLFEGSRAARALFEEADAVLGWGLSELCFSGPEVALTETKVCQPALYVHGCAVVAALRESGKMPEIGASFGLSLGELTAMHLAGVYDFATGLKLVAERGRLMQIACEQSEGGMASVIGGTPEEVAELCAKHGIEMANLNCPGQIVISGDKAKVLEAVADAKSYGFKLVKALNVAGAYHSKLMEPARAVFEAFLEPVAFAEPAVPVYTNVTGRRVSDPLEIKRSLVAQVVSPVHFEGCLRSAAADTGLTQFFECGPGGVLAGLAKRTDRALQVVSLSELADVTALS